MSALVPRQSTGGLLRAAITRLLPAPLWSSNVSSPLLSFGLPHYTFRNDAPCRRQSPHPTATNATSTVWNSAKAVAAATAGVPPRKSLAVTMTSPTPTFRTDVVIARVLQTSPSGPPRSHPARIGEYPGQHPQNTGKTDPSQHPELHPEDDCDQGEVEQFAAQRSERTLQSVRQDRMPLTQVEACTATRAETD